MIRHVSAHTACRISAKLVAHLVAPCTGWDHPPRGYCSHTCGGNLGALASFHLVYGTTPGWRVRL